MTDEMQQKQAEEVDTAEELEAETPVEEAKKAENAEEQAEEVEAEKDEKDLQIEELQAKLTETSNRLLRSQADFDNYRRRVKLDQEAAEKYRAQSLISELLPALDNFERALNVEVQSEDAKNLMQGVEMVYRQIKDALQKEGVEEVDSVGKEFDPHVHQAVMQVQDDSYESNIVVEEFQKGFKLKDRVLRPAMVKVNQ